MFFVDSEIHDDLSLEELERMTDDLRSGKHVEIGSFKTFEEFDKKMRKTKVKHNKREEPSLLFTLKPQD